VVLKFFVDHLAEGIIWIALARNYYNWSQSLTAKMSYDKVLEVLASFPVNDASHREQGNQVTFLRELT
jgi:hypothetical protein